MERGLIQVYSGEGHGKSAAALGTALQAASTGKDVVIIHCHRCQSPRGCGV